MSILNRVFILASALALAGPVIAQTALKPAPGQPPAPAPGSVPAPDPTRQVTVETTVVAAPPPPAPVKIAPSDWKPGQPIKTSDDLLSALENADAGFRSLQATIRKTKIFDEIEGGGSTVYDGSVIFVSEAPDPAKPTVKPRRMFQVDFVSTTVDGVRKADQRTFIFDGQWFVERQPDVKQIHKRQIVPPGQTIDPLAIGEGPFPVPIGQKRERILQRFTADLLAETDFPDAKLAADAVKDTWQLKLVPRPGTDEAQKYREVRIFYRKSDLLPRFARTVDRDDAVNIIALMNIKLNAPVSAGSFDVTIPQGWDAQIDEYKAPAPSNTAPARPENSTPGKP
jgi:hypothetical protein